MIARLFIFLSIFLLACQNESTNGIPRPKDLLSEEQMIDILTDAHIVEGAKIGRKIMGDTLMIDAYYNKVFSKHQTNKIQFEENYRFYSADPKKMDNIYEIVVKNLNQLQISVPTWEDLESEENAGDLSYIDSLQTKTLMDSLMKDSTVIDRRSLKNLRPAETQDSKSAK